VHLFPRKTDEERRYADTDYDFASPLVIKLVRAKLKSSYADYFKTLICFSGKNVHFSGLKGRIFEDFAHERLAAGGSFKVRRLLEAKETTNQLKRKELDTSRLTLSTNMTPVTIYDVSDIAKYNEPSYCKPFNPKFTSLDAVVQPNVGLQMVTSLSHGYKKSGLIEVSKYLTAKNTFKLFLVVPAGMFYHVVVQSYHDSATDVKSDWTALEQRCEQWVLQVEPEPLEDIQNENQDDDEVHESPRKKQKTEKCTHKYKGGRICGKTSCTIQHRLVSVRDRLPLCFAYLYSCLCLSFCLVVAFAVAEC
jgi:hypothetical protein